MASDSFFQLSQTQVLRRVQASSRPRVFRTRPAFEEYSDEELRARFRFGKKSLAKLEEKLGPYLSEHTRRGHVLPLRLRILLTLRVLASGSFLEVVGDTFGVNKSTASRIFAEIIDAVICLQHEYVTTAFLQRADNLSWFEINKFPEVCGCIDGTHIKILAPTTFEDVYVSRKGTHSINVQIVSTGELLIANCVVKYPGSTHDSRILEESSICEQFNRKVFGKKRLLGDQGYPLKPWLMTPVNNRATGRLTTKEKKFNKSHRSARSSVERTIGILKQRWYCLKSGLRFNVNKNCKVILACIILHNFAILSNEPEPVIESSEDIDADDTDDNQDEIDMNGRNARSEYIMRFF